MKLLKAIRRFFVEPCLCQLITQARAELGVTKVTLDYTDADSFVLPGVDVIVYRGAVSEFASRGTDVDAFRDAAEALQHYPSGGAL